jgi:hypothetical protein
VSKAHRIAVLAAIGDGDALTADLGGSGTTEGLASAIEDALRAAV